MPITNLDFPFKSNRTRFVSRQREHLWSHTYTQMGRKTKNIKFLIWKSEIDLIRLRADFDKGDTDTMRN